ncbi:hypothetical protein [Sphingobacterium paludis]|nr:hypothetical protein [Sphingobacterium paludis]
MKLAVAAQPAWGDVNIKDSGKTFYGNVYVDATDLRQNQTNHESN